MIVNTWGHYLKAHRVTDTAGRGEQGLLLAGVVDVAQQYEAAVTVAHHNAKAPNEHRDSTALGAVADMIVSLDHDNSPLPTTPRDVRRAGEFVFRWFRDAMWSARASEPPAACTRRGCRRS